MAVICNPDNCVLKHLSAPIDSPTSIVSPCGEWLGQTVGYVHIGIIRKVFITEKGAGGGGRLFWGGPIGFFLVEPSLLSPSGSPD